MNTQTVPVVEAKDVKKYFKVPKGQLHAVDGISFDIMKGETLGVVGESGCGKSTLGRTVIGIHPPTAGDVLFNGESILKMDRARRKQLHMQASMIFQDPYSSLNPRMCVADLIADPMRVHDLHGNAQGRYQEVARLMDIVGLAHRVAGLFPHELDGGRRQRIGVARALALGPQFIVCDEPVSALDVSIQAQILNLLMDLQDEMGLTYMFITHDLSVVRHISHRVMVTYLGKCVELADTDKLFNNPSHPYTKALFDALLEPILETRHRRPSLLEGEASSQISPKPGCRFAHRCPHRQAECLLGDIDLYEIDEGHRVACLLYKE